MSAITTRIHLVNGQPWQLAFTPAACVCLEEVSGLPLIRFIQTLRPGSPKSVYLTAYALSASYRAKQPLDISFAEALDHFPIFNLTDPDWLNFEAKVFELVSVNFFGETWAEMKRVAAEAMAAAAQATTESTSTTGPIGEATNSDGNPEPSGTN